jgi:hypothetical protein
MAKLVFNPTTGQLEIQAGDNSCSSCDGASGTSIVYKESGVFTDITETEVLEYTSTNANEVIVRFVGTARTFGVWRVYKTSISPSNLELEIRTSEMNNNLNILLNRGIELTTIGEVLKITFEAQRYRDNILGATSETFVRLEGSY